MSAKIIVDSSVIVKWLNQTNENHIEQANAIMDDTLSGKIELLAPELAKYEIGNALLKGKKLTQKESTTVLKTLYTLPIQFVPESEESAKETYKLASDLDITYYDASFMILSKREGATLITENMKHQGKSKSIKVKFLKDY